ncbi:MAG: carboxypeptidase regulatory-like domain-containing protein, partial [Longimicrobiales bacterium]|nr:carboxypeptidase regulatory-like domain-containing protein [Longimicrobiales bacterium]
MKALFFPLRRALLGVLLALVVVSSCVDGPSGPEGGGGRGLWVMAPVLSLVGPGGERPMTAAQGDALSAAFDRVNRFRLQVRRVSDNVVVLETVIEVTPGAEEYDLTVPIEATSGEEFLVTLVALQGDVELFTALNIPAKASLASAAPGSPPPVAVQIPLVYTGPGSTATSVTVLPRQVVLAPAGSATVGASVLSSSGSVVAGVPLSWATSASGVATVTPAGVVRAVGEGVAVVTATTPTGLAAFSTVYVVGGELAYVEGGALKVRGAAGGAATDWVLGSASQPAWSADGSRLYYVLGAQVWRAGGPPLVQGSWPSVSPDGQKLAVERGGQVWFANDDGSQATAGPAGATPVWADGSTLLVGGGNVQRVRADGTARTTVVGGGALPALAGDGRIASVVGGEVRVTGLGSVLVAGATGRPTWSPSGRWLVVRTTSGLVLVASDGSAAAVALPGLSGGSEPAFRPTGTLAAPTSVSVTGFRPDPPVPGSAVEVQGSGFDWILRGNNRVVWPTRDGSVETAVGEVTAGSITTVTPRNVMAGQVRVETRAGSVLRAFVPTAGTLEVAARTPWGDGLAGVRVALAGPSGPLSGVSDARGALVFSGLIPGAYTATVTGPAGWTLVGEAVRSLAVGVETVALGLTLNPVVTSVVLTPATPVLAVGDVREVELVILGGGGQSLTTVPGLAWRTGSAELTVSAGSGMKATLSALYPGEGPGTSVVEVDAFGRTYRLPVTVTSSISGAVTLESGQTPAPAAPDIRVQIKRGAVVVAEVRTGADGRYAAPGLFRGTYDVVPQATEELRPLPSGQAVQLGAISPTARADFRMQRFAALEGEARTPWNAPVGGVTVVLVAGDGSEVARTQTDAAGRFALRRLVPGTHTLNLTVPAGHDLSGPASRSLALTPGTQTLSLEVTPEIRSVTPVPGTLALEVGNSLAVTLLARDINGVVIPQVRSAAWGSSTPELTVTGSALSGTLGAVYAGEGPGTSRLVVVLNGTTYTLPVTVTSSISGTVTLMGATPAPGAANVEIVLKRGGAVVASVRTEASGAYRASGLFRGTYDVVPAPAADQLSVPEGQTVILDAAHPSGVATFQLATTGTVAISARTPWDAPVRGVGLKLLAADGREVASAETDAAGAGTHRRVMPGSYTLSITVPAGHALSGDARRALTVTPGTQTLSLEVTPLIHSVASVPETLAPAVGGSPLAVTLVAKDLNGVVIPQVRTAAWSSSTPELAVTGSALSGTLSAVHAGEGPGTSRLVVDLNGTAYTFPATVTSSISGTLTLETGATPAPAAPDVTVQIKRAGTVVAETPSGADGRYSVPGLFRATYDVTPVGAGDLLPVPAGQAVLLDAANRSGRADFRMVSFGTLDVTARTPWDTPVGGVAVRILAADASEVARGSTSAEGSLSLARIPPGTYTLAIAPPVGFQLQGAANRSQTFSGGSVALRLVLDPSIAQVQITPAEPSTEVRSSVRVTATALDHNGRIIPQFRSSSWFARTGHLAAGGVGLEGQVGGIYPSEPLGARFAIELNGQVFTFAASVTSWISGKVTLRSATGDSPSVGTGLILEKDGKKVAETSTQAGGIYKFDGLYAGTYTVRPGAPKGGSVSPASTTITLQNTSPTGTADFIVSAQADDSRMGSTFRALILGGGHTDNDNYIIGKLQPLMPDVTFERFNGSASTPSLSYLATFNVVLLYENGVYGNAVNVGNRVAQYVALGGNVVIGTFYWQNRSDGGWSYSWGALEAI